MGEEKMFSYITQVKGERIMKLKNYHLAMIVCPSLANDSSKILMGIDIKLGAYM